MTIDIHMEEPDVQIRVVPTGREVTLTDPESGIVVRLDLPEQSAKTFAEGLVASPVVERVLAAIGAP